MVVVTMLVMMMVMRHLNLHLRFLHYSSGFVILQGEERGEIAWLIGWLLGAKKTRGWGMEKY